MDFKIANPKHQQFEDLPQNYHYYSDNRPSKSEQLKIFGNNLKRLRVQSGITKKAVSEAVDIIPQQYYRYEDGVSEPGVILATKLAKFYNVDVQDLFEGLDDKQMRISRVLRRLNEFGVKAKLRSDRIILTNIIGLRQVPLSLEDMEDLIDISLSNIKLSINNSFTTELTKNILLKMTPKK